jgi:hypothetical protein
MDATTATLTSRRTLERELARRTGIRAFRAGRYLLIVAEGQLPNPSFQVDVEQNPIRIFPQQYDLVWRQRPDIVPQVTVPYRYAEVVRFPVEPPAVVVHHADGQDEVRIEECGEELAEYAAVVTGGGGSTHAGGVEAVGSSRELRFDEAFADALADLPPSGTPVADALSRVVVTDTNALFGGIAGFHHLFVRIRRTHP